MNSATLTLSGWGRWPRQRCEATRPERYAELRANATACIARGQGRAYGDAALNQDGRVILTERLNRFLEFDAETGLLCAEAGATLADVLEVALPRGWFPAVTPGTRFVSLGGCLAADVHGKNHHRDGSFSDHVRQFELIDAQGRVHGCSRKENADLFLATAGGMGLTGLIGDISLQLAPVESAWMAAEHKQAGNFSQAVKLLEDGAFDDHYTVAWIDCLSRGARMGRSVLMRGHHARREELPAGLAGRPFDLPGEKTRNLPFDLPGWLMNPLTIGAFNALYYRIEGGRNRFLADYRKFFHPLDAIGRWNRLYGKTGFVQYQCVLPQASAHEGLERLLHGLAETRQASFLAVLKRFGPGNDSPLSFPMAGYTLALDIPLRNEPVLNLLDELDEIVVARGGRVYLAKDARLKPETFRAMYPRLGEWLDIKRRVDPDHVFSSSLSRRLEIGASPCPAC